MTHEPVWITGVGVCSPVGCDVATVAASLLEGRSAVRLVDRFPSADHPSRIAATVNDIPPSPGFNDSDWKSLLRPEQALIWCVDQGLRSAGLDPGRTSRRVGLVLGIGSEWFSRWEELNDPSTPDGYAPAIATVQSAFGFVGPTATISAACASGNHAIAIGRAWLRLGLADVVIAGGCDMAVTPLTLAAFGNLRALSRRNDEPLRACRPFDSDRDGFVLGEGAAVCLLERADDARRRRATGLAEVAGFGATSDAYHLVSPSPDPGQSAAAIRRALDDACVDPAGVDYINAHGTGTPVGDVNEAAALRGVFGESLMNVPCSSIKPISGHMLCAAAAFEAVACVIAIGENAIPPTLNLEKPDPACPLHHVTGSARACRVDAILSNSFGFGGSNTALLLRRVAA